MDINALPSMGKFYPNDTKIFVRSATGGEIKHWSTIVPDNLQSIDAAMNYVIERCCKISIPGIEYMGGNWKDLIANDQNGRHSRFGRKRTRALPIDRSRARSLLGKRAS